MATRRSTSAERSRDTTASLGQEQRLVYDKKIGDYEARAKQYEGEKADIKNHLWQVALDMEAYAESPNHEAEMPNYIKAQDDYGKVFTTLSTKPDLDIDKTITDMVTTLQSDFNASK